MTRDERLEIDGVEVVLSAPVHNYGHAPRKPRRPPGKARGVNNIWIYDRRATQPGGMHRLSNATVIVNRVLSPHRDGGFEARTEAGLLGRVTADGGREAYTAAGPDGELLMRPSQWLGKVTAKFGSRELAVRALLEASE